MSPVFLAAVACLTLVVLSGLVLLKESRQGRVPLALGLLLTALVELLDSLAGRTGSFSSDYRRLALFCNILIPATLLLYGMLFTRRSTGESRVLALAPLLVIAGALSSAVLLLPTDQFFTAVGGTAGGLIVLGGIGYWFYLGLMIFCIAALVNLESVFTGIRGADRWRVKYEFLGVGAILAVMIFFFSQGLLYRSENMSLRPVRSGVVMVAALMIGYSRLYRGRTANLVVSRQALYRSFTLVAVGVYLLVLGLLGEGMRLFNVPATRDLSAFVAILSGIAFLVLLLSEEIRRRLKVFLSKHFYAQKHDYREEWLGFSNALSTCRGFEEVGMAIIDRYQQIFGVRYAALYARDGRGASFELAAARDRAGMPARVMLSAGLLGFFSETGRVMNPTDGEYAPGEAEATFIRDAAGWLLIPLLTGENLEAFVVLGQQVVPERLTYEDFDLMKILGRQAVLSLNNFKLSEELAAARELAAVAKVSSFVIHDLKNLAYTFSLMMDNAGEHIGEPEFQRDLVKSIQGTVAKMNALIAKLKVFPQKRELNTETADIAQLARETLGEVRKVKPAISFQDDCSSAAVMLDVEEMKKVVLNLLLNACDVLGSDGRVVLRTGKCGAEVFFSVQDNGSGMSESFVKNHLFRPFRTTKEKGLGIGLYQSKQIVEAHGGSIVVESREGSGASFTVTLPAAANGSK